MKIDSTIYNHYPLIRYEKPKEGIADDCTKERSMGKNVDRGYNSGSSVSFGSAANFSLNALNKLNLLCESKGVVAGSLIALFYAACLRPIAIMSLPGKKDRDDKIYASGHAIASGVIGYIFSNIVMYPFDKGSDVIKDEVDIITKKLTEAKEKGVKLEPKELVKDVKYLNEKFIDIFCKVKEGKVTKLQRKIFENTIKAIEFAPDTLFFGIIKAMLTIALIPPILKYVFGVEKKSKQSQANSNTLVQPTYERPKIQNFIGSVTPNTNNSNSQYNTYSSNNYKRATFKGKSPFLNPIKKAKKRMDIMVEDFMAKHYNSKIYQSPIAKKIARIIEKFKLNSVVEHMQILNSTIISGMYMRQTLRNKDLDTQKRKTLAINQFLTFFVSTLLSIFVDKWLNKGWESLTRRYAVANLAIEETKDMTKAERKEYKKTRLKKLNEDIKAWDIAEEAIYKAKVASGEISADSKYIKKTVADYVLKKMSNAELTKEINGMGVLKKLFVFTTIYRFVAPVAVTPLANWIGNKYIYSKNEKNKAN